MSGLYLIGVVVSWVWLTWLLLRFGWRKLLRKEKGIAIEKLLVGTVILAWLGASFWYGGGRKYYYDWQVERMCAVDGGVRVYETVKLPADKFNQWGQISFYRPDQGKNTLGEEYLYKSQNTYLYRGSLEIRKDYIQIFRNSDMKLLGEVITYVRSGGDLPGPWQPSAHRCPDAAIANGVVLMNKIFIKHEGK